MGVNETGAPRTWDLEAFRATDPHRQTPAAAEQPADAAPSTPAADSFSSSGTLINPSAAIAATVSGSLSSNAARGYRYRPSYPSSWQSPSYDPTPSSWNSVGSDIADSDSYLSQTMSRGSVFGRSSASRGYGRSIYQNEPSSAYQYGSAYGRSSYGRYGRASVMDYEASMPALGRVQLGFERFTSKVSYMAKGLAKQAGIGAAVGAVLSLANNAYGAIKGRISVGEAAGNVAEDTVSSGISAVGGAVIGGVATAALGAFGVVGLPLTLLGIGASIAGGVAADTLFRKTSIAQKLHDTVANLFGGHTAAAAPTGPPLQPAV